MRLKIGYQSSSNKNQVRYMLKYIICIHTYMYACSSFDLYLKIKTKLNTDKLRIRNVNQ